MIEVRDARKWIQNGARRVEILKGISLIIPAGQIVAIVGASGSGKSTLLGLLAGLDTPSSGEIWLDGAPIHNLAEAELAAVRGRKIGFVFQSYQLIATLTALENVLHKERRPHKAKPADNADCGSIQTGHRPRPTQNMRQHEREDEAADKGSSHSEDLVFRLLVFGEPDELPPGFLENHSIPKSSKKTLRCGRNDDQGQ